MGPVGQIGPVGPQGPNGYNSLLLITDEVSGTNCTNGGTKIQVGLDQDRSGVLDSGEILQTKYICNGATPGTQPPATLTATASPSTQTFNSFVNITATVNSTIAKYGGSVYFHTPGSCALIDPRYNAYSQSVIQGVSPGGTASVALTSNNTGSTLTLTPCIVYADYNYYDSSTNTSVTVGGSALATFVPDSGTTPVTPPPPNITVTASPSTQTFNSFVNITATVNSTIAKYGGSVYFYANGSSCSLIDPHDNLYRQSVIIPSVSPGGTASVALSGYNMGPGGTLPCIVYADYNYYDSSTNTSVTVGGSALATFELQAAPH
jgi:hypothetical protein